MGGEKFSPTQNPTRKQGNGREQPRTPNSSLTRRAPFAPELPAQWAKILAGFTLKITGIGVSTPATALLLRSAKVVESLRGIVGL